MCPSDREGRGDVACASVDEQRERVAFWVQRRIWSPEGIQTAGISRATAVWASLCWQPGGHSREESCVLLVLKELSDKERR